MKIVMSYPLNIFTKTIDKAMKIMIILILAISLGVFGGLWNRIRGGWSKHMDNSLMESMSHGFRRIVMALISTICLYVPVFIILQFNPVVVGIDYLWFLGVWLTFWIIGLIPGWGSWFLVGRDVDSWKHNQDALLAEVGSFLYMRVRGLIRGDRLNGGYKWIPSWDKRFINKGFTDQDYLDLHKRFNLISSPDGNIRSIHWRIKMEKVAMAIRGLYITIPGPIVFALHMYYEYGMELWGIILIFPTGLLFAWCYEKRHLVKGTFLPKFMQGPTELGEVLAGASIMSAFLLLGSALSLIII